jgi:hypothetical protein
VTTKPPLQKILQGILHTESETHITMKGQAVPNYRKRKSKKIDSNIDFTTHPETTKTTK